MCSVKLCGLTSFSIMRLKSHLLTNNCFSIFHSRGLINNQQMYLYEEIMYIFLFGHYSFDMWAHLLNHLYSGVAWSVCTYHVWPPHSPILAGPVEWNWPMWEICGLGRTILIVSQPRLAGTLLAWKVTEGFGITHTIVYYHWSWAVWLRPDAI